MKNVYEIKKKVRIVGVLGHRKGERGGGKGSSQKIPAPEAFTPLPSTEKEKKRKGKCICSLLELPMSKDRNTGFGLSLLCDNSDLCPLFSTISALASSTSCSFERIQIVSPRSREQKAEKEKKRFPLRSGQMGHGH